jgi:hypothetical protein
LTTSLASKGVASVSLPFASAVVIINITEECGREEVRIQLWSCLPLSDLRAPSFFGQVADVRLSPTDADPSVPSTFFAHKMSGYELR